MKSLHDIWFIRELIIPVFDICIVAYLIYKLYLIISETRAIPALRGLFLILLTTLAANLLYLETLGWVLERFLGVAAIALIVLFQPELRRILMKMGQGKWLTLYMEEEDHYIVEVIEAAEVLSARRIGALIVFERGVGLKNYIETGTILDSNVTFELLMTIFSKDSPMHDGAVIIEHKRLAAAGCYLPLSTRRDIRKGLGTRHRAAIGLSAETDAIVLVVSEENGRISLAMDGRLRYDMKPEKVKENLKKILIGEKIGNKYKRLRRKR